MNYTSVFNIDMRRNIYERKLIIYICIYLPVYLFIMRLP